MVQRGLPELRVDDLNHGFHGAAGREEFPLFALKVALSEDLEGSPDDVAFGTREVNPLQLGHDLREQIWLGLDDCVAGEHTCGGEAPPDFLPEVLGDLLLDIDRVLSRGRLEDRCV